MTPVPLQGADDTRRTERKACVRCLDMVFDLEIRLRYETSDVDAAPTSEALASEVARLVRRPVIEMANTSREFEPIDEPTVVCEGSVVSIKLGIASTRKGSLQRLGWVISELVARLLREAPGDRPDLATDPIEVSLSMVARGETSD